MKNSFAVLFILSALIGAIAIFIPTAYSDTSAYGTAVLIAGAQSNALSILTGLMVIGAVAFGALYISVKRKHN